MTRPEALTTLRDARETYDNLLRFLTKHDSNLLSVKTPITDARLLQFYVIDKCEATRNVGRGVQIFRWREQAFPLYYAIRMACIKFRQSCPDGDLIDRINTLHKSVSQVERIGIFIRTSISILHGDH